MKEIAIVTDSTADLPEDFARKHNIKIIPLRVIFPDGEYRDGVDIKPAEFYSRLRSSDTLPKSSQPPPEDFVNVYQELLKDYREIISIHLSSSLSGTINAAKLAREKVEGAIHIFDSYTVSLGIGLQVREAVDAIKRGNSCNQVLEHLKKVRDNSATYFTLDTLKYLYLGGRISKAKSLMGSILNVKPILKLVPEGVAPAGRARNKPQVIKEVVKKFQDFAGGRDPGGLAIAQGDALEMGKKVQKALEKEFGMESSFFGEIGPTLGVHSGPGVVGVCMFFK